MNYLIEKRTGFNNLSVKDLLEARDLFHVHLMSKANVIGTAVGRYLIRDCQIVDGRIISKDTVEKFVEERTLANSRVTDDSWPCLLVFVKRWVSKNELRLGNLADAVPPNIYMPDGRIVPVCVVAAPPQDLSDPNVDESKLIFPDSAIGGGYPLLTRSQGMTKIASVGCIVTDGGQYYALTNKHVLGNPGDKIFTKAKSQLKPIGKSTNKVLGNIRFQQLYQDWAQTDLFVNVDAGLIEISNINLWKTDIYQLGRLGKLVDLNSKNLNLKLIGLEVCANGAVSGKLSGEIVALFYRYKSVGGYEYVADFLIGPRKGDPTLPTRHGDSGTVWTIEEKDSRGQTIYSPFAMQWGQRSVAGPGEQTGGNFALASNLSHVCRELDVEIVRDWNLDLDFTWGKSGHFKIGYGAAQAVSDQKLFNLLDLNADNLGVSDRNLIAKNIPPGMFSNEFVPLADVPDMYWRTKRPDDKSNHFADMDDQHPNVYQNQRLMDLCFDQGKVLDAWLDIDKWLDYYHLLDVNKPETSESGHLRKRLGGVVFRVWQMYNEMVSILKNPGNDHDKLAQFLTAGGTMAHYVGDACQPLHISALHDGYPNGQGEGVHSAYETKMLDTYERKTNSTFLAEITNLVQKVSASELFSGGKNAGRAVLELMYTTYHLIPPAEIVDNFADKRSVAELYKAFGDRTKQTIANGIHTMGVIWQSAWLEGEGDMLQPPTVAFSETELMNLYKDQTFVPAYKLDDPRFKAAL